MKVGYSSTKIEGASDLETACRLALDVYLELQKGFKATPAKPKERVFRETAQSGGSIKTPKTRLDDQVHLFLQEQQKRVEAEQFKPSSYRNLQKTLINQFIPYCEKEGLVYTRDIKVGCLDSFTLFSQGTRNTQSGHLKNIKTFLRSLARKRLLDPYEAALIGDIVPKVKIRDIDLSANPPFRDEQEWLTFVRVIHGWVKEAEQFNNNRILYFRRKMWTLIMVLKQSGGRPNEILNMTWKDIETQDIGRISESQRQLDEQTLREQGIDPITLTEAERESLGRVPRFITHLRLIHTKTGSPREVTCNSAEVLSRWKKFQQERLDYVNKKHSLWNMEMTPDTRVFDSPIDGDWKQSGYNVFTTAWLELRRRAEDKLKGPLLSDHPYTIYSLRSTRAQELLHLGVDVAVAAKSLGHSANMMLRVYAKLPVRSQAMKAAIAGIEFGKKRDDVRNVELDDVT